MRIAVLLGFTVVACSSDSTVPADDASLGDSAQDTSIVDSSKSDSSSADVVTSDAGADTSVLDASNDADLDASVADANDGATSDAGGCMNVVCNKGLVCCNIQKSFNFSKCYNPACLACCQ